MKLRSNYEMYVEWCPHCGDETEYTILDLGGDEQIECMGCKRRLAPCDLCIHHGRCGGCKPWLTDGIKKAKEGYVILETYPQQPLPKGIQISNDTISDDWLDNHLTRYGISEINLEKILAETNGWDFDWFMKEWTWDMAETIYLTAQNMGIPVFHKFIGK